MPVEHMVDEKTGIMRVRRWGEITTHDEEAALKRRNKDPLVVPNIPVIVDCREVDPPETTEVVQYIANQVTALAADLDCGPVAIVVSSDVEYGMARMYMALTHLKHPNTMVFRSNDNALKWLRKQIQKTYSNNPDS
ncbi:MAG: hypothetical protein H8D96_03580 [Desulfobacterales bacterium]|uniref:DUF7793 domain-containing protein n=1 Tax=Candidatus Desulfatibia vada TaxID=2841696 RepID=A0A8J6NPA3_9BACT|nr:hypothetical protein [Candidatus Desulfatibia vada]MBL6971994.1 hypothetical protein [Desulfobacterales bacterium]